MADELARHVQIGPFNVRLCGCAYMNVLHDEVDLEDCRAKHSSSLHVETRADIRTFFSRLNLFANARGCRESSGSYFSLSYR